MTTKSIALIDFNSIFRRLWAASEQKEIGFAQSGTVSRILGYASKHDACAVALDSPPYDRRKLDTAYKAHHETDTELLKSQRLDTIAELRRLGFYLLEEPGLEADDMIASAVAALAADQRTWDGIEGPLAYDITIYSADKDLLALHADVPCKVRVVSTATHEERTPQGVFGVEPKFVPHVLAIVGDTSDNVPGIRGIGPKKAAALIAAVKLGERDPAHDPSELAAQAEKLEGIPAIVRLATDRAHEVAAHLPDGMGEAAASAIIAAVKSGQLERALKLTTLVARPELVDVERVFAEREAEPDAEYAPDEVADGEYEEEPPPAEPEPAESTPEAPAAAPSQPKAKAKKKRAGHPMTWGIDTGLEEPGRAERLAEKAPSSAMMLVPDAGYLEPTTPNEAWRFCEMALSTRIYDAGSVGALMLVLTYGHSLGLPAMASLRGIFVFTDKRGKAHMCVAAQLLQAICMQHPSCEILEIDDEATNDTEAVVIAKRKGGKVRRIKYTIEMAQRAWLTGKDNWKKNPEEMLSWRAMAKACRRVFPDACFGIYTREEMEDATLEVENHDRT